MTIQCDVGTFGTVGPYLFGNYKKQTVTIDSECHVTMLEGHVQQKLRQLGVDSNNLHFQQDGSTTHTSQNQMAIVRQLFETVFYRFAEIVRPTRLPNLIIPDFFR